MSWNVSLNLSNLYQAVKLLQSTAITNPISSNLNLNNFAITGAPIIQGGIAGGGPTLQTYTGTTALTIDNSANITGTVSITTPTLMVSSGGLIRLNGNSSTSTLQMSNSTGVLILLNNINSTSYEVPVGAIHSFKVNTVEIAKVESTGLTLSVGGIRSPNLGGYNYWMPPGAGNGFYITDLSTQLNTPSTTLYRVFGLSGTIYHDFYNSISFRGSATLDESKVAEVCYITPTGFNVSLGKTLTTPTITFSGDGSSLVTANDVYINETTSNTAYPVACVGGNTTGRTSLYTDGVGHITYNPSTNLLQINNNGKISLNGATALLQNTTNTLTYRVPSTFKHSFEVVSGTEIAKIDSTGLNLIATKSLYLNGYSGEGASLSYANLTGIFTLNNPVAENIFNVPSSGFNSFRTNNTQVADIDSTGLYMYSSKTITLAGNSSTSTLSMNNSTGLLTLQNNNNSNSYQVPTSQNHSFKVNNSEIANINGGGVVVNISKTIQLTGNSSTSSLGMNNSTGVFTLANNSSSNSYETVVGAVHSFKVAGVEIANISNIGLTLSSGKTAILPTITSDTLQHSDASDLTITNTGAGNVVYKAITGQKHSFLVNNVETANINGSGVVVNTSKTITLNGNSSTSTLSMNNSTGVFTLANNSNSNSYETISGAVHSFKVNNVETVNIDSGGLNLPSGFDLGLKQITSGLFKGALYFGSRNNGWSVGSNNISQMFVSNTTNGSTFNGVYMDGTSTSWNSLSDIKLKQDVSTLQSNLEKIIALRPVSFKWISNPTFINHGFIANEVKEIIPEIVSSVGEYLGMNQQGIIPFLVGAVKEQQVQIQAQQTQIQAQQQQINDLLKTLKLV